MSRIATRIARTPSNILFEGIQNINKKMSLLCRKYEDQRPYSERRLDPVLCEQDVKQGFKDRRNRPYDNFVMFSAVCIAPALPDAEEEVWDIENQLVREPPVIAITTEPEESEEEEMDFDVRWEEELGRRRRRHNAQLRIKKQEQEHAEWMAQLPPPPLAPLFAPTTTTAEKNGDDDEEEPSVDGIYYGTQSAPVKRNRRIVVVV